MRLTHFPHRTLDGARNEAFVKGNGFKCDCVIFECSALDHPLS
jgi:hypothetical protein